MEQRPDETKEEFAQRKLRAAERDFQRVRRSFELQAEPKDLYADSVTFHEDRGVLRIAFYCTRPETGDAFSQHEVPVARVSFHLKMFRHYFEEWLRSEAGREAASE